MRRPLSIAFAVGLAACGVACRSRMARIEEVRDALARGDAGAIARQGLPACSDTRARAADGGAGACLTELADALGSKSGFRAAPPDQASAAAAAVILARDGHGDWLPSPADGWIDAERTGRGPGADALRIAVARAMIAASPSVARAIGGEKEAIALIAAASTALPGTCGTYALVARGAEGLPPELTPEHSACVQKDLERPGAPGGAYGHGVLRAAEGIVAVWRAEVRALRDGLEPSSAPAREALARDVAALEADLPKISLPKLPPAPDWSQFMADVHAPAAAPLGADAGAGRAARLHDGGAPHL